MCSDAHSITLKPKKYQYIQTIELLTHAKMEFYYIIKQASH